MIIDYSGIEAGFGRSCHFTLPYWPMAARLGNVYNIKGMPITLAGKMAEVY